MAQVYGADEVNAVVLDPGSAWTRTGWAGEDAPSSTISSWYAYRKEDDGTIGARQYDDDLVNMAREGFEVANPYENSLIKDFEAGKELWNFALAAEMASLNSAPLLVTQPAWADSAYQKQVMEYCFEETQTPAAYLAKSAVCSLFSAGRGSGLVIDAGAQSLSVTPVVDGLVLNKPSLRSNKAGNYLNDHILSKLGELDHKIVPYYQVSKREQVGLDEPAKFTKRELVTTDSFHNLQVQRVLDDFKETIVQVAPTSLEEAKDIVSRVYEFPDGHSAEFGKERFELGESLFKNSSDDMSDDVESSKGVSQLVIDAINACDVDIRANLTNNIVITGGTSLLQGFTARINHDLQQTFPALKVRLYAPGNMTERRNAAWLGGSILASLGTFHQLWVSKQEWDEVGAEQIVAKRFR